MEHTDMRTRLVGLVVGLVVATVIVIGEGAGPSAAADSIGVAPGTTVELSGLVEASVVVEAGAILRLEDADVTGSIYLHHAYALGAYRSTIEGTVVGSVQRGVVNDESGVYLSLSTVTGRVAVSAPDRTSSAALSLLFGSEVFGGVVSDGLTVRLSQAVVHKYLVVDGTHDRAPGTVLRSGLSLRSSICDSHIEAGLTVRNSSGYIDIGGGRSCRHASGPLSVSGRVAIRNNDAHIAVAGYERAGVTCAANTHFPRADTAKRWPTIVLGAREGQCARLGAGVIN
jgi:hypothetical protein